MKPQIGDVIAVEWPGHDGLKELGIFMISDDPSGIECVFFGEDGVCGAEAIEDLELVSGVWRAKQAT